VYSCTKVPRRPTGVFPRTR